MTEEYNESIFDIAQDDYLIVFNKFKENLIFENKTISEWLQELSLKELHSNFSTEELEEYNILLMKQTDIIYTNYSLANSNYKGLKGSLEKSVMKAKQMILQEIDEHNKIVLSPAEKRKYPNNDVLESMAYNRTDKLQFNLIIAEVWDSFWESQVKKVYALNQRVTSLSVGKNTEAKMSIGS